MMDIYLTKGDTGIGYRATLTYKDDPVDLTNAEVIFLFNDHKIYPIKEIEKGKVRLAFEKVHTTKTGVFRGCFKVRFKGGRKETYPGYDQEKILVKIGGCC